MEKELKEYLDKITDDVAGIRETMATKSDLAQVREEMATKKELQKVERRLTKKMDNLQEYVEAVDKGISDHRRNTEAHNVKLRNA